MDIVTQVQILDKTVCISHSGNALGKAKNPTILHPAMGKIVWLTVLFNLSMVTGLGEGKLNLNLLNST